MKNPVDQYSDIPQEWICKYVSSLMIIARTLPAGSDMQASSMIRAEYALDLIKAYRDQKNKEREQ